MKAVAQNSDECKINVFITVKPDILHKDLLKYILHAFYWEKIISELFSCKQWKQYKKGVMLHLQWSLSGPYCYS